MPDFVKPMKIRISFESLNGTDCGQTLYQDYIFFEEGDFDKDWKAFVMDRLDVLTKIEHGEPF